jgi:hypothetical protein
LPAVPSEAVGTAPPTGSLGASPPAVSLTVWGPLAVIAPDDGADTARAEGTLRITADCVLLETGGDLLLLLLWDSDEVSWDATSRTITYTNWDGSRALLRDGDAVVLGGGGGSAAESGVSGDVWFSQLDWVAEPQATCPRDPWWGVGHAEVVAAGG